jgi:hypothetical protein
MRGALGEEHRRLLRVHDDWDEDRRGPQRRGGDWGHLLAREARRLAPQAARGARPELVRIEVDQPHARPAASAAGAIAKN